MDFTKLVDLIDTSELYFTRADKFDDVFEGSFPIRSVNLRKHVTNRLIDQGLLKEEYMDGKLRSKRTKSLRKEIAINSWHMNDHESAAMWKLYLKSDEGISIQTTYANLINSFSSSPNNIRVGLVKYIDYERSIIDVNTISSPYLHKRLSYEHEKELRALIWCSEPVNSELCKNMEHGLRIKVDLDRLIERIYLSPTSPKWINRLVKSVLWKYGIDKEVIESDFNKDPLY